MASKDFNPFGTAAVEIIFKCDNCNNEVKSEEIYVPSPNYDAETASDSQNDNDGYAVCQNCEKEFEITIYVTYGGGTIEISDIEDEDVVDIIEHHENIDNYYEEQIESIINNKALLLAFMTELDNLQKMNQLTAEPIELEQMLKRQIFSGVVTCMEAYLSDTLIKAVLGNEIFLKNFVRSYSGIANRKFSLGEIFEKQRLLEGIVKKELLEIIYHNLPKVGIVYKNTLGIDFQDISELMKIVTTRHDMVHRNGKSRDGEIIEINKDIVDDVIKKVREFLQDIEAKLSVIFKTKTE